MSLSNRQIKLIRSLHRKKFRNKEGQFLVEGIKILDDVVHSSLTVDLLVLTPANQNLQNAYSNLPTVISDEKTFGKISSRSTSSGVLAVVKKPQLTFNPERLSDITLMLDSINDPGNLGTIIRTADWFGINDVICSEDTVDVFNPKTIQSTMGSIARINVFYHNLTRILPLLTNEFMIIGLFMQGDPIDKQKSNKKNIIVAGSEANGISKSVQGYIHKQMSISRFSPKLQEGPESLNASIATAIACYELRKNG